MHYYDVVIDSNSKYIDMPFTYMSQEELPVGQVVLVQFGKSLKSKKAVVIGSISEPYCDPEVIKSIEQVDNICLSEEMVRTALWMKKRYGIKYIEGLKCFIPKGKSVAPEKRKNPCKDMQGERQEIKCLTPEQKNVTDQVNSSIEENRGDVFLIHGVTSSGKTEVYMQAIQRALELGKTAIMLVPEITLTKQIVDRFIGRFGSDNIAILHSKLTPRQRYDQWERLNNGEAKIAIGARTGVFAPLKNIGVIILDEEHETAYKSDMSPKYDTVDVALKRARSYGGTLVLGSATPSVTSYYRAEQGIYKLLELKNRYNKTPLPKIDVVDMRQELMAGNTSIFSRKLYNGIYEALEGGQQVILFLNRRGYSEFVSCRKCGETVKCDNCHITMTYHKYEHSLVCHYCGRKINVPIECPKCGSKYIKNFGIGTQQVEEMTREKFPRAIVERLDLDTAKTKGNIQKVISGFADKKIDILVGTQLVAKGLDFNNVGLVGVVAADMALNVPDYRASENNYQLITQVSGRAGRGSEQGKVVVQTYCPEHFSLGAAARQSYDDFYKKEIGIRKEMNYPPFTDVVEISFLSAEEELSIQWANNYVRQFKSIKCQALTESILLPKISYNTKGNTSFRSYTIIKCPKGYRNIVIDFTTEFRQHLIDKKIELSILIDVNPY